MGPFVYELDNLERSNFQFDSYGVGFEANKVKTLTILCLIIKAASQPTKSSIVSLVILAWFGNWLDSCDGATGQYLKYNNPHKLSLYLLCELPIIIWDKAAMADFVEQAGIGIRVSALKDIKQSLSELTPEQIAQMKENVLKVKADLQTGQNLSKALEKRA